jgi:cellulose synthase/poly-beta-1,6-N-acetylglucosamine synthase-like glycosyltransferase
MATVEGITTSLLALAVGGLVGYGVYVLLSFFGIILLIRKEKNKTNQAKEKPAATPLTVLIPARNEALHIDACLQAVLAQTHPNFKVLVLDDASTDDTAVRVRHWAARDSRVRLLHVTGGKKAALARGIATADTDWVVTLDADCVPPPSWLLQLDAHMYPDTAMVCGPVRMTGNGWLSRVQALESAGLMVLSAGAIGLQLPGMNNGGNLAFRKAAFAQVGGYDSHRQLASGDDMLLMHSLHRQGLHIAYAFQPQAVVATAACTTWRALLAQRLRWVSKARAYRSPFLLFGSASLFLFALAVVLLAALALVLQPLWPQLGILMAVKAGLDLCVLLPGLWLIRRPGLLVLYPLVSVLQLPYTLWAGLAATSRTRYNWKGRRVQ